MKTKFSCLLCSFLFGLASAAEVTVRGGKLVADHEHRLLLNDKVISTSEGYGYDFPELVPNKFRIKDADVILISEGISASCTLYFFVLVTEKQVKRTEPFGTCDDGPSVELQGHSVVIKMKTNEGRLKTYRYEDGVVKDSKIKLASTLLATSAVNAQTLPVACEQYLAALDACTANSILFFERVDIKRAKIVREKQQEIQGLRELLKKGVIAKGSDAVAEHCMKPEFTRVMFDNLNLLITPLVFAQAINEQCYGKFQEIRTPSR